jgi:hypothetical protein
MNDRVEIFVAPGWQVNKINATVTRSRMPLAAVNRDAMPACRQTCRKLLGERLKPAIAGGNPSSAKNRDARRCLPLHLDYEPPINADKRRFNLSWRPLYRLLTRVGSEQEILNRDRQGAVVKSYAGHHTIQLIGVHRPKNATGTLSQRPILAPPSISPKPSVYWPARSPDHNGTTSRYTRRPRACGS